jgi:hypothetical protein
VFRSTVVHQEIFQLYVPVHHVTFVEVFDALTDLVEKPLREMILKFSPWAFFQEAVQGAPTNVVHDYVDVLGRIDRVMKHNDIGMP